MLCTKEKIFMKSKKSIRVIAIILVLLMILPFLFDSLAAYAVTQDEINAIQSQKKELSEKVSSCVHPDRIS